MADFYIGEIRMFAGNFAPKGWTFCNGQILPINQNPALFSLLGTYYGGNGTTTFALPDLRGRGPIQWGQGPGLDACDQGQPRGAETATLAITNLPVHTHLVNASNALPDSGSPAGNFLAAPGRAAPTYATGAATATMASSMLGAAGGNQPFYVLTPYLAINFIIALQGTYPQRP